MVQLPPGLVALVRLLPRLLFPSATAYLGLRLYKVFLGSTAASQWLSVPACLLALPATSVAGVMYAWIRDRRRAAARGAVMPPTVKSCWPGALDKLAKLVWNYTDGYLAEYIESECNELGNTINIRLLYENRFFTTEPEYIKAILATQFPSFDKGPIYHDQFNTLLGTGVFNSDGDVWKFHRTMTRPFFNKDRLSDFDIFEKHAEDAINQMKIRLREGYPVDIQDVTSRFTLDSATEFLFGTDVCSLSAGILHPPSSPLSKDPAFLNHPSNRFASAFMEAQSNTAYRSNYGSSWRITEFWKDQVEKHMKVCFEFIDPIVADAIRKKHERGRLALDVDKDALRDVKEGKTLLDHLVNYTEDKTVIRDEALNIMIAGRDTTAGTLTSAIYMLSQHPDIHARLREEIVAKVGISRRPTHEDMKEMKYLRAFINEVLRLYPPVPINVRLCTEEQVWPATNGGNPIYIPPNTIVLYSVFLMHRRKDLWGADADLFDPDRFLDARLHKYLVPNPFIFGPFSAGPRICLGQQFAYHEVSYFLIRLLQSIDVVSLDMATQHVPPAEWASAKGRKALEKVLLRSHLTMYVEDGLWVKMKEAESIGTAST